MSSQLNCQATFGRHGLSRIGLRVPVICRLSTVHPVQDWLRTAATGAGDRPFLIHPDGGTEPIGSRIIEIPEVEDIVLNRDPRLGFVAYVPTGSIAKGRVLANTGGGGKTVACTLCHGETLQGEGDVPAISGRHPNYIVRQLWSIKHGDRKGEMNDVMVPVVQNLSVDDMLAIAAYTASLDP